MIHITVRGGAVVKVEQSRNIGDICIITDYDNRDKDDQTFNFPIDFLAKRDAELLYKKAQKKKGWRDTGGETT